jgi:hypothetical protein
MASINPSTGDLARVASRRQWALGPAGVGFGYLRDESIRIVAPFKLAP